MIEVTESETGGNRHEKNKFKMVMAERITGIYIGIIRMRNQKEPATSSATGDAGEKPKTAAVTGPLSGKRVALIMEFNTGTFSQQYVQGVKEEIAKFGGELTTFVADNDKAKMVSLLDSAINQKFDVILTDHGDSLLEPGVKKR